MGRFIHSLFGAVGTGQRVDSDGASSSARRVACAAVILIGCAFSYSIGWQRGWMDGDRGAEHRLDQLNEILLNARAAAASADADTPDPLDDGAGNV